MVAPAPALLGRTRVTLAVRVPSAPTAVAMLPPATLRVTSVATTMMPATVSPVPQHAGVPSVVATLASTESTATAISEERGVAPVATVAAMGLTTASTVSGHDGLLFERGSVGSSSACCEPDYVWGEAPRLPVF